MSDVTLFSDMPVRGTQFGPCRRNFVGPEAALESNAGALVA